MKPLLERQSVKEILELSDHPTIDEVKKNYKRLVKLYHPDINKSPEAGEYMKRINQAYEMCTKKNLTPQQEEPQYRSAQYANPTIRVTMNFSYGSYTFYTGNNTETGTW